MVERLKQSWAQTHRNEILVYVNLKFDFKNACEVFLKNYLAVPKAQKIYILKNKYLLM